MNRRIFTCRLAEALAASSINGSVFSMQEGTHSLRRFASRAGVKVGACVNSGALRNNDLLSASVIDNFDLLVANNEMKWDYLEPTLGQLRFAGADALVSFAKLNHLALRGHNLIWNASVPSWLPKAMTGSEATKLLTDHVSLLVKRFNSDVESWDVVNEPLITSGHSKRSDMLSPGPFLQALGESYIDLAFHVTQRTNPLLLRVLNVYAVEHDTPEHEINRQACLALLKRLIARGVPIQALGIESHIDARTPIGGDGVSEFVKQVLGMGLQILITELDVSDYSLSGGIGARDEAVAQRYFDYITLMVPLTKTNRVVFWSPSDAGNWMDWQFHGRPDGTSFRPGLFDKAMAPKSAYRSVISAFSHLR